MRLLFPFLLGLTAGGVLVWALVAGDPAPATMERANGDRTARPAVAVEAGAKDVEASATPKRPSVEMPDDVAAALAQLESADWRGDEEATGLVAIAYLYGLAGRETDFLRVAGLALGSGAPAERVLYLVGDLPNELMAAALDRLLASHPDAGWNLERVAEIYFAGDARERGIAALERGVIEVEDERGSFAARYVAEDPDRAARFLARLFGDETASGGFFATVAEALVEQKRPDLARPFLQRALELMPTHNRALDMLGKLDPAAARAYAETRVKKAPEDGDGWAKLARLRRTAGDTNGAFAAMQQALKLKEDEELYWDLYRIDAPRALPIIRKAVESTTNDEVIGMMGDIYVDYGMPTEALAAYERAHEHDRTDTEWLRAIIKLDARRAVALLRDIVEQGPPDLNDELVGSYANALRATGKPAKAFEYYLEAMRRDPDDGEWLRGIAELDSPRAIPILRAHLAERPDDETRAGGLATALARNGDTAEALQFFRRAVKKSNGRGWFVPMAQIAPDEVIAAIRAKIEKEPSDDEHWGDLGKVYESLGRPREARAAFEKAKELDPGDSEWTGKLSELRR